MDSQPKPPSKRKLINKVRRKDKKRMQNLVKSYASTSQSGSAIGIMMNENQQEMDFDLINHITTGENRKLKKKMKKLKKKISGDNADDKIFREMQKYKASIHRIHDKTVFDPAN